MRAIKYIPYLSVIIFFACSCRPEPNLMLSSPEAFAFDLGDSWEVNASVTAKDFAQVEKEDQYFVKLSYSVDLVSPESDSLKSIYNESIDQQDSEEFLDIILEAQIEIDSTFGEGKYKLVFNVIDEYSGNLG